MGGGNQAFLHKSLEEFLLRQRKAGRLQRGDNIEALGWEQREEEEGTISLGIYDIHIHVHIHIYIAYCQKQV